MKNRDRLMWAFGEIANYVDLFSKQKCKVIDHQKSGEIQKMLSLQSSEDAWKILKSYLQMSVKSGHRHFFNQLYGGLEMSALIAEFFSIVNNVSTATYEMSPLSTQMERIAVQKMLGFAGMKRGEGMIVPGGSYANMFSMLVARNRLLAKCKGAGLRQRLLLFVSASAHYSFERAANTLGIGTNNVIKVATDDEGRMIPEDLNEKIEKARGGTAFYIGATAGTTVEGAIDPLIEIAKIARKHRLWLHVDGAIGASLLLSPKRKKELQGIASADSLTWDAHKAMGVPLTCSLILFKKKGGMRSAVGGSEGDYLFHHPRQDDIGTHSLQCGRRADGVKLWMLLKVLGERGLALRVEYLLSLAAYAAARVKQEQKLQLLLAHEHAFGICFRYNPNRSESKTARKLKQLNQLNIQIREEVVKEGKFLLNYASIKGSVVLRPMFLNPLTTKADIDEMIDKILDLGRKLAKI
ncbi:MAG: glutamate decarboxylase [Oligoflexia bacterium]|nr:glutamate decarboxylase [Oligoflexia bacterium]MBF0365124.1 glutamate decarboxylase [Oligoflexia bacterium]